MEFGRVLEVTLDDIPQIRLIPHRLQIDSLPFRFPNPEIAANGKNWDIAHTHILFAPESTIYVRGCSVSK